MPPLRHRSPVRRSVSRRERWLIRSRRFTIFYVLLCVVLYFQQQRLIFHPFRDLEHTPDLYHLNYQTIWVPVTSSSGKPERMHSWWIAANQPDAPVMLYIHHNSVNIGANVSQALQFQKLGYSVFLFDYRGFGQSEGKFPTEAQVYEDAEATWNYLTQVRKVPSKRIVIYGHSVGGAIAINLATHHPEARALIVQSSFTSMRDMTKRFGVFWVLPVDLLLHQKFESLQKIKSVKLPVLIIQGTEDIQIPAEMGRSLYDAAPNPQQLLIVEKGGHDNHMSQQYTQQVKRFIEQH